MRRPGQVLAVLNDAFLSEMHGGKHFTIWSGVYQPSTRTLAWSGGGHHPAILLGGREPVSLPATGPIMGAVRGMEYPGESCRVGTDARLLIFSDGVFEILRDNRGRTGRGTRARPRQWTGSSIMRTDCGDRPISRMTSRLSMLGFDRERRSPPLKSRPTGKLAGARARCSTLRRLRVSAERCWKHMNSGG
jgi:hypothetical protein